MLLCIDIGNTNITFSCMKDRQPLFLARLATDPSLTSDQYAVSLKSILELYSVQPSELSGAIIASVVPPVLNSVQTAVRKLCGLRALIVGPGVKTGLNIAVESPGQVGSDIISACVGAISKYPAPMIVIDVGTVITLSVVTEGNKYIGGSFLPGLKLSLDAIQEHAAQLPGIALDRPNRLIGRNTVDCLRSGLMYGYASMLDGMIERIRADREQHLDVIITGGVSSLLLPLCKTSMHWERDLVMQGLWQIYTHNLPKNTES